MKNEVISKFKLHKYCSSEYVEFRKTKILECIFPFWNENCNEKCKVEFVKHRYLEKENAFISSSFFFSEKKFAESFSLLRPKLKDSP